MGGEDDRDEDEGDGMIRCMCCTDITDIIYVMK